LSAAGSGQAALGSASLRAPARARPAGRLRRSWVVPAAVILAIALLLSLPMLLTTSGMSQDWPNHLWVLWQQSMNIRRDGLPSLFLNQGQNVFYPLFAFYGGTLYTLGALLSLLLGDAPVKAYVITWVLGFSAALGSFYWLARTAGAGRVLAHVPGVVFVTSSYVLTDVYARGAWPEFIAVCAIPLWVASGLAVLRSSRLRPGPAAALALATIVLFGSHNITMLWGVTYLAIVGLLALTLPQARALVTKAAVLRVGVVVAPSIMVNAWFLLPALAYASHTFAGHSENIPLLRSTSGLVAAAKLFTFSRASAVTGAAGVNAPDFALSLPLLAIAWTPLAALLLRSGARGSALLRLSWILIGVGLLLGIVMTHVSIVEALPGPYAFVQFQYRISSYILLSLAGAMIGPLALLSARGDGRALALKLALVPVVLIAAEGAIVQIAAYPSRIPDRNVVFDARVQPPPSVYSLNDYDDDSLPLVGTPARVLFSPPSLIHGEKVTLPYPATLGGTAVQTNVLAAPYLLAVHGAHVLGRTAAGPIALQLPRTGAQGGVVTLQRSGRLPLVLGRALTVLGLVGVLAVLAWSSIVSVREWRRRRGSGRAQPARYQST
jgi:hypothetical protein